MSNRGSFNAKGQLTIHGRPRFVLGVYDSGGGYSSDPAQWEHQIFEETGPRGLHDISINVYLNYHWGAVPITQTRVLLDVLERHGISYLQTGNCFENGGWHRPGVGTFSIASEAYVKEYAKHPAALGYYIMDECADSLIEETTQHNRELHQWDPEGITLAVNYMAGYRDPTLWNNTADIMGIDPYPLTGLDANTPFPFEGPQPGGYTHFIVADFVSKLRAGARADRPVWAVLQMFKGTANTRMPTPDEMRAHAIMAIVEGAGGIFWWEVGNGLRRNGTSETTAREYIGHLRTLVTELAGLESALLADNVNHFLVNNTRFPNAVEGRLTQLKHNDAVEWLWSRKQWYRNEMAALQAGDLSKSGGMLKDAGQVRTRAMIADGQGYVFAYNYKNEPVSVRFDVPLAGLSWSDEIGSYGGRIYVMRVVDNRVEIRENKSGRIY